ncbi:MAG TPA: protein-export chaperone SecB [Rhodospirillales bacterium]|nr:protein-export chaperone SecB [Rhodospirillales bacterium]
MTDKTKDKDAGDAAENNGKENTGKVDFQPIVINAQYIKDLSFEAPASPGIFAEMHEDGPDVNVNVEVKAEPFSEGLYEVLLNITANCRVGSKTSFIMELVYGGLFTVKVPQEHLQPVLLIECPRLLFPFARNILADVTRDGGFPPLMLGPVDFVSMFQNRIHEIAGNGKDGAE